MAHKIVASFQGIDEMGSIGPLPGEGDVIEATGVDEANLAIAMAEVLKKFPNVDCFDVTISRITTR